MIARQLSNLHARAARIVPVQLQEVKESPINRMHVCFQQEHNKTGRLDDRAICRMQIFARGRLGFF